MSVVIQHIFVYLYSSYSLTVLAADQGTSANTASCNVSITLDDVNDHEPVVTGPLSAVVPENVAPGHMF